MDQLYVYITAAVIAGLILARVFRADFDAFEPIWLFLLGYLQVYVVQAISYREYALRIRGEDLVTAGNLRALWALGWFLAVYYSGLGKWIARVAPAPPTAWSTPMALGLAPVLCLWGLVCSGVILKGGMEQNISMSEHENLLLQFPVLMLVSGVLLIVTGNRRDRPMPAAVFAGLAICSLYSLIWILNGKRSHALFGILAGTAALFISKRKKPPLAVLAVVAVAGALSVALALNWRSNYRYERNLSGFAQYLADFDPSKVLESLNMKDREDDDGSPEKSSRETEEYCGFLLMLDTVPNKSEYDYGSSYLRIVTTFIPRLIWEDKPYFGREQWVSAWIAGSEFHRDEHFTGPAVSILGATQLNGGAIATLVVLFVIAVMISSAYHYQKRYPESTWCKFFWPLTYFNAWLMTVNDDPFVWFYYMYGFGVFPSVVFLWIYNKWFNHHR